MAEPELSLLLKHSTQNFIRGMTKAMNRAAESFRHMTARLRPIVRYRLRQQVAEYDEFIHTNDWKSPECTGWLCDDCPQRWSPGIQCAHTCHGGTIK